MSQPSQDQQPNQAFEEALQLLNPQQKEAVDTIDGPVMVLAGPGTGKTQIMSLRIANILRRTDTQPHNILALTFTNAAAKNLQQRLLKYIGPGAYAVKCTTFHSFAAEVISENQEFFPVLPTNEEPVSQLDQFAILEDILVHNEFARLKNPKNPFSYIKDILQLLLNYKREGWSPLQIKQLAAAEAQEIADSDRTTIQKKKALKNIEKNLDLAEIYAEYQRRMREQGFFDYEDLIIWVRDAFRQEEDLRLEYQEKYHYFLIDEYQDTNQGQLQIVQELASFWGQQANIFVVGDPNQSIYRFQGASLANTLSFIDLYPESKVISLVTGYRCGQPIYDAAAKLIAHNALEIDDERLQSLHQPLQHPDKKSGEVISYQAPTSIGETVWIIEQLRCRHQEGTPWSQLAVLYRKHSDAQLLIDLLEREQIPFQLVQNESILNNSLIQQLILVMQFMVALSSAQEDDLLLPLLQTVWFDLPAGEVLQLIRAVSDELRQQKRSDQPKIRHAWDIVQDLVGLAKTSPGELKLANQAQWQAWVESLNQLYLQSGQLKVSQWLEQLLAATGFYEFAQQGQVTTSDLVTLSSWLQQIQHWSMANPQARLADLLTDIQRLQEHNLSWEQEPIRLEAEAVVLSTAHQAKGQEWDYVFILHAHNKTWGNIRRVEKIKPLVDTVAYSQLDEDERNADERRLFYVALTRAKQAVAISGSQQAADGERTKELQPTQFLKEIPADLIKVEATLAADDLQTKLDKYLPQQRSWSPAELNEQWLWSLVNSFAFSFTALRDYQECPVGFFYKHLLKVPQRANPYLILGSAVHAALEALYRYFNQKGKQPTAEYLQKVVRQQMNYPLVEQVELDQLEAQAQSIVYDFWQAQQEEMKPSLLVERFFGGSVPLQLEGLPLVGKIDRLDIIDDLQKTVRVVDYKTGKTHSRNHILGKAKSADVQSSMFRQLVFYRLLGDLDPSFDYQIIEGEFVFVEPNPSGKYKSERFSLQDRDVEELKDYLVQVKNSFYNLDFLQHEPCGHCDTCAMLGFKSSKLQSELK